MPPIPVVIYGSKSTEDTRESLPAQFAAVRERVGSLGDRSVEGEHSDEAASGWRSRRADGLRGPGAADAREQTARLARSHGEAELWVFHSNRLGRGDAKHAASLSEWHIWAMKHDVKLRSVSDDELLQLGDVGAAIAGKVNRDFSEALSSAVRRGKNSQLAAGRLLGGPVPDGLLRIVERDANDRVVSRSYIRCGERAPIIEKMFALSESGHGDHEIARRLNARGVLTRQGNPWIRRRVQDTLTNPVYAGFVTRNRNTPREERVPATNVEALVTPERFEKILSMRQGRDRIAHAGRAEVRQGGPGRTGTRFALSKLGTCGRCGERMFTSMSTYVRKDGTKARYYVCKNVHGETGLCDMPRLGAEAIDAALVPYLAGFFSDYAGWFESVRQNSAADHRDIEKKIADLEGRLEKILKAESRTREERTEALAADDDHEAETLKDALKEYREQRVSIEERLAGLRLTRESAAAAARPTDDMLDYWRAIADGIVGRLTSAESLADINAELRTVLGRVLMDCKDNVEGDVYEITPYTKAGSTPGVIYAHPHLSRRSRGFVTVPHPDGGWALIGPTGKGARLPASVPWTTLPPGVKLEEGALVTLDENHAVAFNPGPQNDLSENGNYSQEYRWTKWKRPAFAVSQRWVELPAGPVLMSSSVA